ncbi:uncharacterized protein MYCFIDRAFT_172915 [Pseudocercospora fijiensis CIRAD86]|uniref:Uncharacterized protein n=1 Tax=Pseudocercospora fijiensis (strain CIRAD86) TaxID=383855 RepID=M2Z202_PSEFD|nr:uncharacterized protein MYCFIDRAFT_172915 [Pseudocercospora fijiensis CIRAD86]EME83845.1 hypothetical protein MYCFIDRAFT_172915 [Pseudocercospora fijiensis CIRAD86]
MAEALASTPLLGSSEKGMGTSLYEKYMKSTEIVVSHISLGLSSASVGANTHFERPLLSLAHTTRIFCDTKPTTRLYTDILLESTLSPTSKHYSLFVLSRLSCNSTPDPPARSYRGACCTKSDHRENITRARYIIQATSSTQDGLNRDHARTHSTGCLADIGLCRIQQYCCPPNFYPTSSLKRLLNWRSGSEVGCGGRSQAHLSEHPPSDTSKHCAFSRRADVCTVFDEFWTRSTSSNVGSLTLTTITQDRARNAGEVDAESKEVHLNKKKPGGFPARTESIEAAFILLPQVQPCFRVFQDTHDHPTQGLPKGSKRTGHDNLRFTESEGLRLTSQPVISSKVGDLYPHVEAVRYACAVNADRMDYSRSHPAASLVPYALSLFPRSVIMFRHDAPSLPVKVQPVIRAVFVVSQGSSRVRLMTGFWWLAMSQMSGVKIRNRDNRNWAFHMMCYDGRAQTSDTNPNLFCAWTTTLRASAFSPLVARNSMNAAAGAVPPQFAVVGKKQPSRQREQQEDMGDYRPIYTNSYQNPYETYPQAPVYKPDSNSHSNGSNRSRHSQRNSVHGTTKGRLDDDRLAVPDYMHSERHRSNRERRGRSSRASHDSDDSYHDRRRRDHRSRSRRRERDKESNNSGQKQQEQQQDQEQEKEKKTGLAKFDEYITPFNVGILLGCFDLIGGGLSLYMTKKRFGKKAQAAQAAQNGGGTQKAGGANGGGGAMAVPVEVPDDHEGAVDDMTGPLEKARDRRRRKVMTVAITEMLGKSHIAWSMIVGEVGISSSRQASLTAILCNFMLKGIDEFAAARWMGKSAGASRNTRIAECIGPDNLLYFTRTPVWHRVLSRLPHPALALQGLSHRFEPQSCQ